MPYLSVSTGIYDEGHTIFDTHAIIFRTYIPPAFYGRDGSYVQPPSFEMTIESFADRIISENQRDK